MTANLRYLRVVLRHKWFVLVAGVRVGGIPLVRLLAHDLSKFGRAEWGPYVRRFVDGVDLPDEWKAALDHHVSSNAHHWEFWLSGGEPMVMPEVYVREMVADWMAAGRVYMGEWDAASWYARSRDRIRLHPDSRTLVESLLAETRP